MPTVTEITAGWNYTQNESGISATRVFIDIGGTNSVELPIIGEKFVFNNPDNPYLDPFFSREIESVFATLICRKIKQKKYGSIMDSNIYYCFYTNEITDPSQYLGETNAEAVDIAVLPITAESGGQFELITAEDNTSLTTWQWENTGQPVYQATAKTVITDSFRVTRVVYHQTYYNMMLNIISMMGTVNRTPFFIGSQTCEVGTVLFTGVNISQYIDHNDQSKYRVELLFEYKTVMNGSRTGGISTDPYDGWNYIINIKSGTWDLPKKDDGTFIYEFNEFQLLMDN